MHDDEREIQVAELSEAELRVAALDSAVKFGAYRAAHGRVIPGTKLVLDAADSFLKFLQGESVEDVTDD